MESPPERFEDLYRQNQKDLFSYIIRSVREENLALDLLQDVFLNFFNVYRSKPLPDDIQCRMYLFKIARNLIINHGNKAYTRKVDLIAEYSGAETPVMGKLEENLEEQVLGRMEAIEQEKQLQGLLTRLIENERTILLLRYSMDMNLEEIAEVMDISTATASRLVRRAAQNLRDLGEKSGFNPRR